MKLLERLNATDAIARDFELVEQLAAKLPPAVQWEWSRHLAREKRSSPHSKWEIFQEWVEELREAALESKLRALANAGVAHTSSRQTPKPATTGSAPLTNSRGKPIPQGCYRCGKLGHMQKNCPDPSSFDSVNTVCEAFEVNAMADKFLNTADREKAYARAEEKFGKCPLCQEFHSYQRNIAGETHTWPSSQLQSCERFKVLYPVDLGAK